MVTLRIPLRLRNHLQKKGVDLGEVEVVIEKHVHGSDLDPNQDQFSILMAQVCSTEFLTAEEKESLDKYSEGGINAMLVEPCLDERPITFAKEEENYYTLFCSFYPSATKDGSVSLSPKL